MQPIVNIALRAARLAGEQVTRAVERLDLIKSEQSGVAEFIAETCTAAERTIVHTLQKAYPHHTLRGEFSGLHKAIGEGPNPCEWQINPLDSLENFSNGLPIFALSLTGRIQGRLEHALIINPITGEEFTASRGNGAQLNGRRLRVSPLKNLNGALIASGYHHRRGQQEVFAQHQRMIAEVIQSSGNTFSSGSTLLDLAYTAAGRLDGFFQAGLNEWEQEAGILLIQEAGGLVGDFRGGNQHLRTGQLVAGNPKIFKALLKTLQPLL
ncbi:inositol monophosphatase family protein [Nitrincola tapanii]|uniref:Inositol monophosphatase n=1 Tax=Nitrincola tapanii TaxID=1708751 RepID=A0A5A9W5A3_9GAMM|nr:inositol monophosphatase family protein [Nitrincola tapanii]KAA0874751.1 inositol monophosphatase [Nitrincola tapanii]